MMEIQNKYKIGVRRFNINWIGIKSLIIKENLRFLSVFGQTIVGPIITAILFLVVINLAVGDQRNNVLGVEFIIFLAPGLIAMQVISQSFAHSSSSILMGKVMGNIVDLIGAPLSAAEVTLSIISASVSRSIIICILSTIIFTIFIDLEINNYLILICYLFLSSFILGAAGFIAGLWAEKFDNMATVTNFIIIPLSFLSGTFYSVESLPNFIKMLSYYNPFFHMIDGFRYAFISDLDGSLKFGLIYLSIIAIIIWYISYYLYKKGYKIKS
ncbi:MAG: multidrug ABC transporter permease [Candidatus Pelagibacter sp.]|nr:multidrug ABC transporter permease [Candidatus Pelagibacter sp.]